LELELLLDEPEDFLAELELEAFLVVLAFFFVMHSSSRRGLGLPMTGSA
jgi:hypothetical protein